MAIQIIPILKALGPLVANAGSLVASFTHFRPSSAVSSVDDRLKLLENEVLRAGEVLSGATQQLQALAQELRAQAELNEAQDKKIKLCVILSIVALCVSTAALAVAVSR